MALVDVFYPGNPRKRDEVVRLSSKLATLLESNFKKTNDLIDCIHRYIPGRQFRKVKVDTDASIKHNCEIIQSRLREIQAYLDAKAGEIRRNFDPSIYDQLMSPNTKFIDKVRVARSCVKVGEGVAWIVFTALIIKGTILTGLTASIGLLATCAFAGIVFGVLLLGIDAIISAFLGYYERKELDRAIKDLEDVIRTFEPASDKFNKEVERVIIRIEDNFEN